MILFCNKLRLSLTPLGNPIQFHRIFLDVNKHAPTIRHQFAPLIWLRQSSERNFSSRKPGHKPQQQAIEKPPELQMPKRMWSGPLGDKIYVLITQCMELLQFKKKHVDYKRVDGIDVSADYVLVYHATAHKQMTYLVLVMGGYLAIALVFGALYQLKKKLDKRKRKEYDETVDQYDHHPDLMLACLAFFTLVVTVPLMFAASRNLIRMYYSPEKENFVLITYRPFLTWRHKQTHCQAGQATFVEEGFPRKVFPLEVNGKIFSATPRYFWSPVHFNVLLGYMKPSQAKNLKMPEDWHFKHWWVEANEGSRRGAYR